MFQKNIAATLADKLTDEKIKWSTYVAEADVAMRHSDYGKAEELYTKALWIQPDNIHVLNFRSKCRALNGDFVHAEKDADHILLIDPKSPIGHMCKADALY
ncbi:hypothetical protein HDV03_001684, partial [Kappamyces sp. JEL0829]